VNVKKYFEFTKTINGTNYFLQQLLTIGLAVINLNLIFVNSNNLKYNG